MAHRRWPLFCCHALVIWTSTSLDPEDFLQRPVLGNDKLMVHQEIVLWPPNQVPDEKLGMFGNESIQCIENTNCTDRRIRNVTIPTLLPYPVPFSKVGVVIAPGGGYNLLAIDREGNNIARWLNRMGSSAWVLKYRVPERSWLPFGAAPLMDAQRSLGLVRRLARQDGGPSHIGFMGFSAGAHLTGHLNVAHTNRSYPPVDAIDLEESCRPDFSIMVYPWRSVSEPPVREPNATSLRVTLESPPTLLIQTQDDPIHVENALFYYLALKNAGVIPSELHIYPSGGHGYGDCTAMGWRGKWEVCTWTDRALAFLKTLGVLPLPLTTD